MLTSLESRKSLQEAVLSALGSFPDSIPRSQITSNILLSADIAQVIGLKGLHGAMLLLIIPERLETELSKLGIDAVLLQNKNSLASHQGLNIIGTSPRLPVGVTLEEYSELGMDALYDKHMAAANYSSKLSTL